MTTEYRITRYATVERAGASWVVISEVSGLPLYADDDADYPVIKRFPTFDAARVAAVEISQNYAAIARGRR